MKSESQLQSECVQWLWNNHPETRGLFFSITNNSEHVVRGLQRKALGMIAGVADTCFLWNGKAYFIEFKNEIGKQSPDQVRWEITVWKQGFEYVIVRSLFQFQSVIENILQQFLPW